MPSKPKNTCPTEKQGAPHSPPLCPNIPSAAKAGLVSYFIFRTAKTHRALAGMLLRPLNLYPGQELLLMQLWDQDNQPQSQLVEELQLDASTVTKMVQRLEQQGFVTRESSEIDRRAVIVRLTPEGLRLKSKIAQIWAELEALTLCSLTEIERNTLCDILEKVIKNLDRTPR